MQFHAHHIAIHPRSSVTSQMPITPPRRHPPQAEGLPAIERTIELNPAVADRLQGRVLQWGDETAAAQLLATNRVPASVVLCSDLLYGDGPPLAALGGKGKGIGRGEEQEEEEEEVLVSAAEALAITLSAVVCTIECTVLSCHERR